MSTAANTGLQTEEQSVGRKPPFSWLRLAMLGFILVLLAGGDLSRGLTLSAMKDAFLQVTVFVAATLALVFWIEKTFSFSLGELMRNNLKWQPVIASALGALPGCGGAIIVVTQFTRGYASFGAFISVLVATMGDAAFLLIAREPKTFLVVIAISLVAGTITGMLVDKVHGRDFMAVDQETADPNFVSQREAPSKFFADMRVVDWLWYAMVSIGLIGGVLLAFQIEPDDMLGGLGHYEPTLWFGFIGALLSMTLWAFSRKPDNAIGADSREDQSLGIRTLKDTNFVTGWVVMAFVLFEIAVQIGGLDISALFKGWALILPLVAILVGFIPGCGPQIVVASLYLGGVIPMSALLSNAIANDGDALFPALALAPRAAIYATIYSAVPAVIIGYAWLFAMEWN